MILVVDTNIVFSGILSPDGTISDLLLNSTDTFTFYAPSAINGSQFSVLGCQLKKNGGLIVVCSRDGSL